MAVYAWFTDMRQKVSGSPLVCVSLGQPQGWLGIAITYFYSSLSSA